MTAHWMKVAAMFAGAAAVAGCGGSKSGNSQTQNNIDAMRAAANQSAPAAAEVLNNEARNLSGQNVALPPNAPNSPTQQAMNKAGNVATMQEQGAPPRQAPTGGANKQ